MLSSRRTRLCASRTHISVPRTRQPPWTVLATFGLKGVGVGVGGGEWADNFWSPPQEQKFESDDVQVAAAQRARDAVETVFSAVFVLSGGPQWTAVRAAAQGQAIADIKLCFFTTCLLFVFLFSLEVRLGVRVVHILLNNFYC